MKNLPFLIQGPGSHSELLEEYLDINFPDWDSLHYWPKFTHIQKRNGRKSQSGNGLYDIITHLAYGINNRLSGITHNQQMHKEFLNFYYDHLCSSRLTEAKSLIAWTMVSLRTIKKNRKLGGMTVLEHGMAHIDEWMSENEKFYLDSDIEVKPGYSSFTRGIIKRMKNEYAQANYIQVHSSYAKETFLKNNIPSSKLLVCELGINPGRFPNETKIIKPKNLTLLYVGRLELLKGVHLLLEVVSKFKSGEIDLILVGRVMPEIEPFLFKYRNKNIQVVGAVDKNQVSRYYQSADALVFPTLSDGFGMVMLEAMIHGLPVIGGTASAAPDVITNEVDGLIIPSGDKMSLEKAISWSLDNRDKLSEMGENARVLVKSKYLSSHYYDRLNRNLKQVGFLS